MARSNFTLLLRSLITSTMRDFFCILNWRANSVVGETFCFSNDLSSMIFVGKCPRAITHKATTVRRADTSVDIPRGASTVNDLSVSKSCCFTASSSFDRTTLKAANNRPSTSSPPPSVTFKIIQQIESVQLMKLIVQIDLRTSSSLWFVRYLLLFLA